MIRKQDILDRAAQWQLRPDVVEKDYVLGWLLTALASQTTVRPLWIFKGGTCIKKCYFETYRFSEDLDFSLLPDAPYSQEEIAGSLRSICRLAAEMSGIELPLDRIEVRARQNLQRQPTFEGRVYYRGPLVTPQHPRVLFDITRHEPILTEPVERTVLHPYPDAPQAVVTVLAYSFEELLAEKTRALSDRARPRDLYDVVYLLDNHPAIFDFELVRSLFRRKCESKGLLATSKTEVLQVLRQAQELLSEWPNMLAHQLPKLPRLEDFLDRLPGLLEWIDQPVEVAPLAMAAGAGASGEVTIAPAGIQYWNGGLPVETIRFAGANRLMVEFDYSGKRRLVEPYSLRRSGTGKLLLYAWQQGDTHIKRFDVAMMAHVRSTRTPFQPRYQIELLREGTPVPPVTPRRVGSGRRKFGPTYVFQCPYCQKEFRHSKRNPGLRRHKRPDRFGYCPGRRGQFVRVE